MSLHVTVNGLTKRTHANPPSDAKHPCDRWETMFVYSFICKFTNLRAKTEGFESVIDLEWALLHPEPTLILQQTLYRFILNLRPGTRNLDPDHAGMSVVAVLADLTSKTTEQTCFWDEEEGRNRDPFKDVDGGFFALEWDQRLLVLRTLVDLQLTHSTEIKNKIDLAFGVLHSAKGKKKDNLPDVPEASAPDSWQSLQVQPLGMDTGRTRIWALDDSPRLYTSTNPWKITSVYKTKSTTREEYMASIEELKASAPKAESVKHLNRQEQGHLKLIELLESRVETIDRELTRVQRVRKKIQQKQVLMAQAELRSTRTRRQTKKPTNFYKDAEDDEDDGTEDYKFQEDEDEDFIELDGSEPGSRRRGTGVQPQRRSARTAALNANGKRSASSEATDYKGERRSTRLGAQRDYDDDDASSKRARTEDSASVYSMDDDTGTGQTNGDAKSISAAKPVEVQVPGKKKSKYYYYVSEPVEGTADAAPALEPNGAELHSAAIAQANGADPLAAVNGLANIHLEGSKEVDKLEANGVPAAAEAIDAPPQEPAPEAVSNHAMDVDHPPVDIPKTAE